MHSACTRELQDAREYGPNEVDPHETMFQDLVAFSRQDAVAQVPSPQAREPTAKPNPLAFGPGPALNSKPKTRNPKPETQP